MGFFDLPDIEPDDDDDVDDDDDDFGGMRSAAWVAGVVPVEFVVARSDQAAVVVRAISAYPDGFALKVDSTLRRPPKRGYGHRLHHHPMAWPDTGEPGEAVPDEILRFGISWPDGGQATNLSAWGRRGPGTTEPTHGLETHSGGGSDREDSQDYWAWPLPGPGTLQFVVEWPAYGIEETAVSIDAGLLVEAAARAHPVWPEDAGRASHLSRGTVMRAAQEHHRTTRGFSDN